ncbi:uncharacterized protein ISCGN_029773 [Ixodes scapularis]
MSLVLSTKPVTDYCVVIHSTASCSKQVHKSQAAVKHFKTPAFAPGNFTVTATATSPSSIRLHIDPPKEKNGNLDGCSAQCSSSGKKYDINCTPDDVDIEVKDLIPSSQYTCRVTFYNNHEGQRLETTEEVGALTPNGAEQQSSLTSPSERFLPASAGFVPNLSSLEDAENGTPGHQAGPDRDPQAFSGTVLKTPAGTLRVGSKNRAMTTTSPYPTGSSGPGNSTHPIIAGQAATTFTIVPQHEAQLYLAFKNNRQGIEEYLTNKTEIEAFLKNKSAFEAYMEKKEENDILMQTLQRSQRDLPGDEMLTESGTTPVRPVHTTTPTSESNEGAWQGVKYPNKGHDIKMDQSQPSKSAKGKPFG